MTTGARNPAWQWTLGSTWDGRSVPEPAPAHLTLEPRSDHVEIRVDAPYHGDPPPPGPPGPTPGLWNYEVVELFLVGEAGDPATVSYTEVELSPHGHHLVLRLRGVRQVVASALPLDYHARIDDGNREPRWQGLARLAWDLLPPRVLRANAFAIGGRRHLAAFPVADPEVDAGPDFHRPQRFPPVPLLVRP